MTTRFVAILVCCAASAHAGVVLTTERKNKKGARATVVSIEGAKLRTEAPLDGGGKGIMIFDGDAKKLLSIDQAAREYSEITEADLKAMSQQMAAMRTQMETQMAGMPPEQRKQMEAMMGNMPGGPKAPKVERSFKSTGEKRKVKSWSCEVYQVLRGAQVVEETCAAAWDKVGVKMDDFKGLEKLKDFLGGLAGPATSDDAFGDMSKYPGFPVYRAGVDASGAKTWEEELASVKRTSLGNDKFVAPAGYTKKARGGPMGGR